MLESLTKWWAKDNSRLVASLFLLLLASTAWGQWQAHQQGQNLQATDSRLASTTTELVRLEGALSQLASQNTSLGQSLQEQSAAFSEQFSKVSDTVGTLDKLSKTDPELLQKYSKVYFLNEHYVPASLTNIDSAYLFDKNKPLQILTAVAPFLQKLLVASQSAGLKLQIISAYRSFGEQSSLKGSYKILYGVGTANQFSADQGYSEHQLGTAVDFTNPTVADSFSGFAQSPEYKWLTDNAYRYGFVLSYPAGNRYYTFEPWHWRFVGVDLATRLHRDGEYFYNLDQRTIDGYLSVIFD